jgi:dTDP-4-amino-4,6-dideoxygalactose transaminase
MSQITIPFNRPYLVGTEQSYIQDCLNGHKFSGDGPFSKKCQSWFEQEYGCEKALLTHSCTAALEMAALLINVEPGDEIIMPSYTFVSTANAFVLQGAVPVFVDIRRDTLNIDESKIEDAITDKTKAIVAVHYAGVSCEMNVIMELAKKHSLYVIEDAAQAIHSKYIDGRKLGTIGHIGCLSFHETKNINCGEGGALLVNETQFIKRSEIIREKGTNRSQFFRGQVDKYTWIEKGSSYLPGDLTAAFLWGQLEASESINKRRVDIWSNYHEKIELPASTTSINKPFIPNGYIHNGHMYYLLLENNEQRTDFIAAMKRKGIDCCFHYIPLHSSPAGSKLGRINGDMSITDTISERLVRLPLWPDLTLSEIEYIVTCINDILATYKY